MHEQVSAKLKKFDRRKLGVAVGVFVAIVILSTLLITQLLQPERSVASYCKVYGQEKARLTPLSNKNNPYPSGVFDVTVVDAAQIATSLGKLSKVAPTEIAPEVTSLQKLYQDIHENPSHAITNALNGGTLDDNLKAWTQRQCAQQAN